MLACPTFTKKFVLLSSILFTCACSSDSTDTQPSESTSELQIRLQSVVDEAVESGIPGISLHVQQGDEQISVVSGDANRETQEPVTSSTLFQVASIGKIFTATLILRLSDMDMLRLDDPIDRWLDPTLSNMIADSDIITVKMLLAHTTGIQDYLNESQEYLVEFANAPGKIWTPTEILSFVNSTSNYFEPGAEYRYSNTNYLLLGVIAERVTGVSLGMALRQWVFEPASLENTYGAFEDLGQPEIAQGYIAASSLDGLDLNFDIPADGTALLETFDWLNSVGFGDAPLHATPSDLNQFIRTLIDTNELLSENLKTQMLTESFPNSSYYGLGIVVADDAMTFGHDGRLFGLNSLLYYTPSQDTSYATTINASYDGFNELFETYVGQLLSVLHSKEEEPTQ